MRYLTLDELLYAYDDESGFTVRFSGGKWKLADLNYAALIQDNSVQEITKSEAMRRTGGVDPKEFISGYIAEASK